MDKNQVKNSAVIIIIVHFIVKISVNPKKANGKKKKTLGPMNSTGTSTLRLSLGSYEGTLFWMNFATLSKLLRQNYH